MYPSDHIAINIAIYKAISDEQNLELIQLMKEEYELES